MKGRVTNHEGWSAQLKLRPFKSRQRLQIAPTASNRSAGSNRCEGQEPVTSRLLGLLHFFRSAVAAQQLR
jgi:hypothetical protein